ncbi:MAG: DNA methyltransferase [Anaerolineaceae bacterium]|nr:DNA methyltransferase [Anaerolineaceae bacterium]
MDEYQDFLQKKHINVKEAGFAINPDDIHPMLFDWQREIVIWALRIGKAALFEECGLGKTLQQIEWGRHVATRTHGKVLIVAPLAVAHQTISEGVKIGVPIRYVRHQDEVIAAPESILITNYDMLKEFDGSYFAGVVLDESSILKSYTGSTKRMILDMFESVPYKLACTATPAPNDHLELGNHAQFLDVMQSNEMIQRWFINDSMQAGNYRLKRHAEKDFWKWVTSWAVCISKPGDLGYPNDGFDIPELQLNEHIVKVDHTRAYDQGQLFMMESLSATGMWHEKKETMTDRCNKAKEVIGDSKEPVIIWCDTNDEADYLMTLFPEAVEVRGSQSLAEKERKLTAFSSGAASQIITKSDIAGFGLNWQHCHIQAFVGVTYSFEKTYQALRRSWRFGQTKTVQAHLIYAESEGDIRKTLSVKQEAHKRMQRSMNEAMKENGLGVVTDHRSVKIDIETDSEDGQMWKMYLGDSCQVINQIPDNSIDFGVHSPPFSNLYIYSDSIADMGNSNDDAEFFEHYKFLIKEMYRITKPGRLCAVHCKDLPLYMNRDGAAGLQDFPGMIIRAFEDCGWTYHSRVTIWKDPVIEMQRTKNHGLLHKNWVDRSEVVRQGMADYVVVFRKFLGIENVPDKQVQHHRKPGDFIGENPPAYFDSDRDYSIQVWQRYASPVWFDINQTNVLNIRAARDSKDEKHICPLQLDVIERCVDIWTNPGEVVFSPFAGIGSEGWGAIKLGRKFLGIELKRTYYDQAVANLKQAEFDASIPTLIPNVVYNQAGD